MSAQTLSRRRADAERNRERVLDHAAHLLADDHTVGMAEIARAAGIGRATLYRHFPTREDLLDAIRARALDETEEAFAASRLDEGPAPEALRRLVAALMEVGDRYRFLFVEESLEAAHKPGRGRKQRIGAPLRELIEKGQAAGELSAFLSSRWIATALGALTVTAVREMAAGRLERDEAVEAVTGVLLDGCRAR